MAFAFIKGCLVGFPVVVAFIDHVGYVARVEGNYSIVTAYV